jgi:hypothetical protein
MVMARCFRPEEKYVGSEIPFCTSMSVHSYPSRWPPFRRTTRAPRSSNARSASMRSDVATLFPVIATTSGTFGVHNVKRGSAETEGFSPSRSRRGVQFLDRHWHMLASIGLLKGLNIFGTRIYHYKFCASYSLLRIRVEFLLISLCRRPF